jgi:hypothetical protein
MKSKIIQNIERRLESGEAIIFSQTSNFLKQNPFVEEHFAQQEAFNFTILTCNKNGSVPTSIALHPLVN